MVDGNGSLDEEMTLLLLLRDASVQDGILGCVCIVLSVLDRLLAHAAFNHGPMTVPAGPGGPRLPWEAKMPWLNFGQPVLVQTPDNTQQLHTYSVS